MADPTPEQKSEKPEKLLTLNQQIALLPAAIPDSVLDFLEDFQARASLQTEAVRAAFDPEYLKQHGDAVAAELDQLRGELGRLVQVDVMQGGREIPGGYLLRLGFEKGTRGIGLLTRQKERSILRLLLAPGDYSEAALKELMKNPPR